MTKSEELKTLAQKALRGENIDAEAEAFANKYYPGIGSDESDDVLDCIKDAYIARRFFGKTRYWYSQKINNNIKNGKPADFTDEEWAKLKEAFYTISKELKDIADNM